MQPQHVKLIAKCHRLLSEYVRGNLHEALETVTQEEVQALEEAEEEFRRKKQASRPYEPPPAKSERGRRPRTPSLHEVYRSAKPATILFSAMKHRCPGVLDYVLRTTDTQQFDEIVLAECEVRKLIDLCDAIPPFGFGAKWRAWAAPHNVLSQCMMGLRGHLGAAVTDPLRTATEQFTQGGLDQLPMQDALERCADVIAALCALLRDAEEPGFLPRPEGLRPTPGTLNLETPPIELTEAVSRIRQLLAEVPEARFWSRGKIYKTLQEATIGGVRRQTMLQAYSFIERKQEICDVGQAVRRVSDHEVALHIETVADSVRPGIIGICKNRLKIGMDVPNENASIADRLREQVSLLLDVPVTDVHVKAGALPSHVTVRICGLDLKEAQNLLRKVASRDLQ